MVFFSVFFVSSALASCVALDFRSGLSSTSPIHGVVPPASCSRMQAMVFMGPLQVSMSISKYALQALGPRQGCAYLLGAVVGTFRSSVPFPRMTANRARTVVTPRDQYLRYRPVRDV